MIASSFGGLLVYVYAIVLREGSVRTVFQTDMRQWTEGEGEGGGKTQLKLFFEETSFMPFKAVLWMGDGI